jgi:glucan phosphoethanolaminetransferase (alkaline phosphatase superfamily)
MEIRFSFIQSLLRGLRQPEYVHVLLNPVPVYGLLIAWIGLIIAVVLKSRRAQVVTLVLVLVSSLSAWPVYEFGQQAYDRVLSMTDEDGERWLDEHQDRGEDLIWIFYALAVLSAAAIAVPIKWPRSSAPLVIAVILLGAAALVSGAYIAYAGGRIRHREFRNEPAPPKKTEHEHG